MTQASEPKEEVSFIDDDEGTLVDLSPSKPEKAPVDDKLESVNRELSSLRETIQQNRSQHYGQQVQQTPQTDQYQSELDSIDEQEKSLGIQFEADKASGRLTKQSLDAYHAKAREFQYRKSQIAANRAIREVVPELLQQQQAQHFRLQYSDVYSDQRATAYAQGRYQQYLAMGEQDSPQLVEKAMNEARIQFKMAGANHMSPTAKDRAQLTGVGGGGTMKAKTDNTVRMGKAEKAMAMAMYGEKFNGDEKKVYETWAKGPGLRAKKAMSKALSR